MGAINAVDQAVMNALLADATLTALAPGRVHWGYAPEGTASPFVIVTLQHGDPEHEQGGTAHWRERYQVKVLDRAATITAAAAAASRVDEILDHQPLSISGRTHMETVGQERFTTEPERVGSDLWQHVGRDYEVWSDPT